MKGGAIIVNGAEVPCAAPVRLWRDTGYHFLCGTRSETRWIVPHWTGAENSAERAFHNMRTSKLSVHFIIDQMGEIYQCADANARCSHARENGGNRYGVGIELINRGHGKSSTKGFERRRLTETIHGRPVTYGAFFPAQVASVIALTSALCGVYGLPMRVPLSAIDGQVYPTTLPPRYLASYRGVLGHLHLDSVKPDPGLELLEAIDEAGGHPISTDALA